MARRSPAAAAAAAAPLRVMPRRQSTSLAALRRKEGGLLPSGSSSSSSYPHPEVLPGKFFFSHPARDMSSERKPYGCPDPVSKQWVCFLCGRTTHSKLTMERHVQHQHKPGPVPESCPICGTPNGSREHLATDHFRVNNVVGPPSF